MAVDERAWRKSSYSAQETDCVEVAPMRGATAVRDSKDPGGGELRISRAAWHAFVRAGSGLGGRVR